MSGRWSLLTPHANVLLALDSDPEARLYHLADDAGASYRWMVKITSELLEAGYLERDRHGRTYTYVVTAPQHEGTPDGRYSELLQLARVLTRVNEVTTSADLDAEARAAGFGPSDQATFRSTTTNDDSDELRSDLGRLRHDVLLETEHLRRVQAECRHLEATIERARAVLRYPSLSPVTSDNATTSTRPPGAAATTHEGS